MGKKSKKKVQWRKLSLNELRSKSLSDEDCDDENSENITSISPTPSFDSRYRSSFQRRSFHHSRDQNRFPHNHPPSRHNSSNTHQRQPEAFLERGVSAERCPSKNFNRPFYQENRSHFNSGQKRRPFKHFGSKGGFYTQGYSSYSGEQGPRRRWSEDENLSLEDSKEQETEDVNEDEDKPSQPVHTVFIDNEEYTKIQTPRQEVIFKKSSLDRKRDSVDFESPPSSCGSLAGCDPNSQGDQVSLAGSVEEPVFFSGDEPQREEMQENHQYEDTSNLFAGDPGQPPLAGVVMQQAYPGGPMIPIPVHWTQYLNPGLIPGDTALTPLDPSFTHVIDPKDLPVDPAHILPVQHDSNGCPVTVQVRVNANGLPVEIEPSAFTVSLNTLEPRQQEAILRKGTDILASNNNSCCETQMSLHKNEQSEIKKTDCDSCCSSEEPERAPKGASNENKDSNGTTSEQCYDCSPDSQYATMSEASTAPTTPSGELSDITDSAARSKSNNNDESTLNSYTERSNKLSRLDSLLETEPSEDDYCEDQDSFTFKTKEIAITDCSHESKINTSTGNVESVQTSLSTPVSETLIVNHSSSTDIVSDQLSNSKLIDENSSSICLSNEGKTCLESNSRENNTNQIKKKKGRCNSIDSTISSQTSSSLSDIHRNESESVEPPSKYQVKKNARKLKKEKKRLSKEKNKAKISSSVNLTPESSTETKNSNSEFSSKTLENTQEKEANVKVPLSETDVSDEAENMCTDNIENLVVMNDLNYTELNKEHADSPETIADNAEFKKEHTESPETIVNTAELNKEHADSPETVADTAELIEEHAESPEAITDTIELNKEHADSPETIADTAESNKVHADSPETTTDTTELNKENTDSPETTADTGSSIETSEKEIAENEGGKESNSISSEEHSENYVCKQGFVMVPILTPYYDPAVLYGYPVIVPENVPERNYNAGANSNKKKKKKHRRRYHEDNYLDTELYAGEPFVATPNGYVVPIDASHLCQLHGYQFLPSLYPQVMPDEGYASIDHQPYMHDHYHEISYRRTIGYGDREKRNRYSKYYEEHRKKTVAEVQELQEKNILPKDVLESCDSGVSESEELAHLNLTKRTNDVEEIEKEDSSKKNKGKKQAAELSNETDQKSPEEGKPKNSKKRKKNRKKNKKDIVEILEPDFSSFDSPTPRFEVSKNDEQWKVKQNKNINKNKKKKLTTNVEEDVKSEEKPLSSSNKSKKSKNAFKNLTAKNSNVKIASPLPSPSSSPSPTEKVVITDSKVSNKNKKAGKSKKKNKNQKSENKESQTLELEKEEFCFAVVENQSESLLNSSLSQDDEITSAQVPEIPPQTEEITSQEISAVLTDESFTCVSSTTDQYILSQESGIGVESEESLNCNESYDASILSQEEEEELNTNERETPEQSDENKELGDLGDLHNESYAKAFDKETSENAVTSSDNETTSENVFTSDNEDSSDNVNTYTIDTEEIVPENYENLHHSISTEIEDNDIYIEDTIPTNELDSESLQNNSSSLVAPESLLPHPETFSKDNTNNISYTNLDSKWNNSALETNIELKLSSSENQNQVVSFKDLGVTEAVKRWIREVTPEKAFSLTDESRSIIFAKSKDLEEIESEEEIDCEEVGETSIIRHQSKNVRSNPFVASPSECSLDVSSERVASFASCFIKETENTKTVQKMNSDSQGLDNFDKESFDNLSRERLYSSSSSCSSFPLCPPSEDSSTLLDDPRVYDPSVYSKYYQLGADIQIPPSNSSTRESTLSPSFVESEDVDFCSESESATPTENYTVSIATELLKSEKIRANMAHISPSFSKDVLPMPHCGSTTSSSDINSEIYYNMKIERGTEICGPGYSELSSGIGSSLASTPNTSPFHQFPSQTTNGYSKPKLEPHPLVNLSASEAPLPCRTMCCSVM